MADKTLIVVIKTLAGKEVAVQTRSGEKIHGKLLDVGQDYLVVQREQMAPVVVPWRP